MKKYQQGGYPLPNFWEAGLESLNFDMYKDAFDARSEYSNAFQNQQNAIQPPAPPKKSIWAKRNERRRGEYVDALKEYNDKKDLATNSFKQSYNMMLPLGMLMQGQQGYMDYLSKPKENLQEEQGFYGFQQGGNVNKTGYTPGYSSMNNPYNIIPSNNITMKNTPFPVLGIGSNGQQQMMYPGNNYNFKGSSYVTEIPMKRYQEGGEVNQEPIPLQAEKGEWFSTPDGMLAKVKAKESHKKQDKDNVSDVLQPGSFIYSDDKKLIIDKTKKIKGIDLKEITFGRGPIEYKETEQTPLPEEIKFINIMNKTKMTPAQIAAQIYAKYPSTDREKDAFSIVANEQNKTSRMPYLAVLQELNKRKQTKQPQQFKYGGLVQHYQEGNEVSSYAIPPETFSNMVINQTEAKYNNTLQTKGDPYEYRQLKDGSYQTKKRTASNWINMNENQTAALNKQIEAGIFDANYKPKNVKPAATVRTKQDLNKHEEKVTPYTKQSGYTFTRDFNKPTRTELGNGESRLNIKYSNIPYVPYYPVNNQNYNSSSQDEINTELNIPKFNPSQNNKINTYINPTIRAIYDNFKEGILFNGPHSASDYNYQIPPIIANANPAPQYMGNGTSSVVTNNYQQGGMLKPMGMLNPIYNQPTNNAITGLGYKDPMEQRDKAFRNQGMYGSNLYAQPTTINNKMFNFEQGGYIPHYQQGGSNDKTYGGGMWGGLVGSVTDIVTGIFNQVRGDKNAKKSQAELDANKLEQLKTNNSIGNLNMASNLASYASQDPAYEYLNLSNQYARGDNAYQNIGSNLDNAQLAAQNQATSGASGFMRNAASLGLSPNQAANYAASIQANAIGNNNQLGLNYANQRGSNIQSQLGYNSRYDDMYSQDQQLGGASVRGNLNKLNSNLIAGVRTDGTGKLQTDQNIRNNYLASTMGLRNQRYNQMVDQNMMMGNNIKNAFNSGQGLYLNQQQQNLQNRNNYQNDPYGNYYGFSGSNPYGQFPYDSGSANYQFNPNDPNYDNVG